MKQIFRYGAYGVVRKDSQLLVTRKKSGPYQGLWGLPGGLIEFGETPEEALKRELMEETALEGSELKLLFIASNVGTCDQKGEKHLFHHVGIVYQVHQIRCLPHLVAEEESCWILLKDMRQEELTPFAQQAQKFF